MATANGSKSGSTTHTALSGAEGSNGTLYWYDPSGNILEETDLSGNLLHDYIYFGGKRIARQDGFSGASLYYYFEDHLGTGLMMLDAWGHIQQQSVYYPFGGERVITNNVANNYKFTGLERDSEGGIDHTLNRQYSSTLGRWLSADPVRGCVMNPQKFDRYSYVLDNPATLTDPDGGQLCDPLTDPFCEAPCDPFTDPFCVFGCDSVFGCPAFPPIGIHIGSCFSAFRECLSAAVHGDPRVPVDLGLTGCLKACSHIAFPGLRIHCIQNCILVFTIRVETCEAALLSCLFRGTFP